MSITRSSLSLSRSEPLMPSADLSYCADQVRRHDRARFLTALFAPEERRPDLFALYAFNLEIARTREAVTEPMLGRIRLQWWRETLDGIYAGKPRRHEVVEPLTEAVHRHALPRASLEAMIEAREEDLEEGPPTDLAALESYAAASSGELVGLAARILGSVPDEATAAIGLGYGLAGLLRAAPFRLRHGRLDLPRDLLDRHGVAPASVRAFVPERGLAATAEEIGQHALAALDRGHDHANDRTAMPALLVSVVARRSLKRLRQAGWNLFDPALDRPDPLLPLALWWRARRGRP